MNYVEQSVLVSLLGDAILPSSGTAHAGDAKQPVVLFLQEGVVLKGDPHDDKRNYPGTLVLVQKPKDQANLSVSSTTHIVWIPYTYLFCIAPQLISTGARRTISTDSELPIDLKDSDLTMKIEWMYVICVAAGEVVKLQRKSNLRGKRIIILSRAADNTMCPLIFQEGGMTKFLDELRKVVTLRQNPNMSDEFDVEPLSAPPTPPPATVAEGSEDEVTSPSVPRSATGVGPKGEVPSPVDGDEGRAFRKELYGRSGGNSAVKEGRGSTTVLSHMIEFGHSVTRKGAKIAEVLQSQFSVRSPQNSSTDEAFDVVAPPMEVENMTPIIKNTTSRSLGPKLTEVEWRACFDESGVLDVALYQQARRKAFLGGIESPIRGEVWSFLLNVFPMTSTSKEREALRERHRFVYETVKHQWQTFFPEQEANFASFRERKVGIEKDVVRTDRSHAAFAGDDSVKMHQMRDILITYCFYNFDLGYCQGMSDLVAVILLTVDDEAEAFYMFKHLLDEKCIGNFGSDMKQSMSHQLEQVAQLIRAFVPTLYAHLEKVQATGMGFCFRWLVVLFKREFDTNEVPLLWDVLFSSPFTPQYEIFVAAALLRHVSAQVFEQSLQYDELLKFANKMAGSMKVEDVILLTSEFYDFVSSQMAWKSRLRAGETFRKPKLTEVLEAYSVTSPMTKK